MKKVVTQIDLENDTTTTIKGTEVALNVTTYCHKLNSGSTSGKGYAFDHKLLHTQDRHKNIV
jgi:hypothetical protein